MKVFELIEKLNNFPATAKVEMISVGAVKDRFFEIQDVVGGKSNGKLNTVYLLDCELDEGDV